MHRLKVERLPSNDSGRLLVRLNENYRNGIKRYGVAKLQNRQNGKSVRVLMLGHERDDAIFMPYDIRKNLGLKKVVSLNFQSLPKTGSERCAGIWERPIPPRAFLPGSLSLL